MFKLKYIVPIFILLISFFFSSSSQVRAGECGSFSISVQNDKCVGNNCTYGTQSASGKCYTGSAGCGYTYVGAGSSCTSTPGTTTCACSLGGTCSVNGGACGSSTCTCSQGGLCSGNGSACGAYGTGTCSCNQPGSCTCSTSGATCATKSTGTYGGACASSCTAGVWSTCTALCGGGTQSQTDSCGVAHSRPCNIGACCGNGTCNGAGGETCSTCATDCGVCAPPSGPNCGDNSCNNGETCNSCAHDCGPCITCTPSCGNNCGGSDGCNGTCPSTGLGVPTAPSSLSPTNGASIVSGNGQMTVSWSAVTKADLYEVQVYPTGTAAGQECTVTNHHCPALTASLSYTFTLDSGVSSYTWRVRAINSTCGTQSGPWAGPNTFNLSGGFSGNFYQDDLGQAQINPATGLCELGGATLVNPPVGSGVVAAWSGGNAIGTITNSSYVINNASYNANTTVTASLAAGYRCSCPTGCAYSGVSVPLGNVHYFITSAPLSWWQSANGYLFAGAQSGIALQSEIPLTCASAGACKAAVSTYDLSNTPESDSTSLTGGGSIDSTADIGTAYSYLNESATNTHAEGMKLNGPKEDYNYFSQLYGITSSTTVDFTGAQPASDINHAYYAGGDITINSPWTLNTTDSVVVFVNGNLTVSNKIQVAKGAFLAFIVKGNITFDKTLGSNTSSAPVVAGVYIANGQIITQSNSPGDEFKFIAEGTYVGWTGIQLQRNFNNGNLSRGNTEPIEKFTFRPDFLVTVPEKMTKPLYLWQETN